MYARFTLIGLEKYLSIYNKSLKDIFILDNKSFDPDVLMATILNRGGGTFEPLYNDALFFYDMTEMWWKKYKRTFEKWFNVFDMDYNPIENYDRIEEWTDSNAIESGTTSSNRIETDTDSKATNSSETINQVSAYDSSTLSNHDKSETGGEDKSNSNSITVSGGSDSTNSESNSEHRGRIHGNIGVTTTMTMMKEEINIQKINLYDQIADLFSKDLLIEVY